MSNYLYLDGSDDHNATTPDANDLDITGDIDLRGKVALDDWTPTNGASVIGKQTFVGDNRCYRMVVTNSGRLQITWSEDGVNLKTETLTDPLGYVDGSVKWVRATLDVDNGASGYDVEWFESDDGTSWTSLETRTTAGATSIFAGTNEVEVGSANNGAFQKLVGRVYEAQILDGIGGTVVADFNADDLSVGDSDTDTAVDSTGKTWTINGASSVIESDGVGNLLLLGVG